MVDYIARDNQSIKTVKVICCVLSLASGKIEVRQIFVLCVTSQALST